MRIYRAIKKNEKTQRFIKSKIINAIEKAYCDADENYDEEQVHKTVEEVFAVLKERVRKNEISTEIIDICIESILYKNKEYKVAEQYIIHRHNKDFAKKVTINIKDLTDNYLYQKDWRLKENSNFNYSVGGLEFYQSGAISARYWLENIYPKKIAQAHIGGDIHICDLSRQSKYCYFGDECILIKYNNGYKYISFKTLYEIIDEEEHFDGTAYIKYPTELYVYDKKGFVKLTRVVKNTKMEDLYCIKNTGGSSVIVTENHPIITNNGEKTAKTIELKKDKLNTIQYPNIEAKINYIYLGSILFDKQTKDEVYYINGRLLTKDNAFDEGKITLKNRQNCMDNKFVLTEDLGWLYGLILAEGNFTERNINFAQNDGKILENVIRICNNLNIPMYIKKREQTNCNIITLNSSLLRKVFFHLFGKSGTSRIKKLPDNFIEFNKDFLKGIIGGFLDGDGNLAYKNRQIHMRCVSKELLNQLAFIIQSYGYNVRIRKPLNYKQENGFKSNFSIFGIVFTPFSDMEIFNSIKITENLKNYTTYKSAIKYSNSIYDFGFGDKKITNSDKVDVLCENTVYDITTETGTFYCNGILSHNCSGFEISKLLKEGFKGVGNNLSSAPAKHLRSIINQLINFIGVMSNEFAGAVAINSISIMLAPFIKIDNVSYEEIKQSIQNFVFSLNIPSRFSGQSAFSNITLDLTVPSRLKNVKAIVGGVDQDFTYGECEEEMKLFNKAFFEIMLNGDSEGRPFSFPIPTINIDKTFNWDDESLIKMWEATNKYGYFYFANYVNSDLNPEDGRSLCCRLRLNIKEIIGRSSGLLGGNSDVNVGSIGIVVVNLPRIGFLSKNKKEFKKILEEKLELCYESLEIKRKVLLNNMKNGLYPYAKWYLENLDTYFSTVGENGMAECCLNFLNKGIDTKEGKEFTIEIMDFINFKVGEFSERSGNMYNHEQVPGEGLSTRLAQVDKKLYPEIITAGNEETQYYTGSTLLPAGHTDDLFEVIEHQNEIQPMYTAGCTNHIFLGEKIEDIEITKSLIKKITHNTNLPYISITPTYSICSKHGYFNGEQKKCPICKKECLIYSRIVGYYRPVQNWNKGKKEEYNNRKEYKINE